MQKQAISDKLCNYFRLPMDSVWGWVAQRATCSYCHLLVLPLPAAYCCKALKKNTSVTLYCSKAMTAAHQQQRRHGACGHIRVQELSRTLCVMQVQRQGWQRME